MECADEAALWSAAALAPPFCCGYPTPGLFQVRNKIATPILGMEAAPGRRGPKRRRGGALQGGASSEEDFLLVSQRYQWIDFRGAARRNVTGQQRYEDQNSRDRNERQLIGGSDTEK